MARTKAKELIIPEFTELDIVATKAGHEPVVKEMTYGQWIRFVKPNNGWTYTAYQKGFHSYSLT